MSILAREAPADVEREFLHSREVILLNEMPDQFSYVDVTKHGDIEIVRLVDIPWSAASVMLVRMYYGGEMPDGQTYYELQAVFGERRKDPHKGKLTLPGGKSYILNPHEMRVAHIRTRSHPFYNHTPYFSQTLESNMYFYESPETAAARELWEETGVVVQPAALQQDQAYGYFYEDNCLLIYIHTSGYQDHGLIGQSDLDAPEWMTFARHFPLRDEYLRVGHHTFTPAEDALIEHLMRFPSVLPMVKGR